ncbi:high choriolytic enzyme 1-like isoform X1 [Sander lucioperca]|nr:high choriolytic enzyme 1-like isoform X1 [Sander lucioperca]XP_031179628.1 high choriolytic enzyme 1-like isoform X1 [Sander lucioperca]
MTPVISVVLLLSLMVYPPGATGAPTNNSMDVSQIIEKVNADVSQIIEKANAGIKTPLIHGDIAPNTKKNADPCVTKGCLWPKTGSYVYMPITIGPEYSIAERNIIINSLLTFHQSTCIRFVWRTTQRDYLSFFSGTGCWSYVGRQGGVQPVSLLRKGCLYTNTVQHEVLHALGFHHEHVRSDRDSYVSILTANIQPGFVSNFVKVATNNLGTPYDFNSVMQYSKYSFSKNGLPTITAKGNPNLVFGNAPQISVNDVARVNKLYKCCK